MFFESTSGMWHGCLEKYNMKESSNEGELKQNLIFVQKRAHTHTHTHTRTERARARARERERERERESERERERECKNR